MFSDIIETDWIQVLDVVIRALLSLITLFLVTKMLGKKQVSQLSLFDYVIGISIGNFAAEMTINVESQYLNGITAVVVFGLVAYLVSLLSVKSIFLRRYFSGVPTVLIQNGKLIRKNMRKVKFDTNDLLEECRSHGYFDLNEIEYGIMETNGKLSILPKSEYRPISPKDMQMKVSKASIVANVVMEGKIMHKNLKNMHKTKEWLLNQLKIKGYQSLENVFLVTLDINDKITVYEKEFNDDIYNVFE